MQRVLIDTNCLLRSDLFTAEMQPRTVSLTDSAKKYQLCICMQNLVEYWAVATRPREANGFQISVDSAALRVQLMTDTFEVLSDPPELFSIWQELCKNHKVVGKRVHDARLAATALSNGITEIVTLNEPDFRQFTELTVIEATKTIEN